MAKDGTARGGSRVGSGRKSKSIKEKIENGNPGGRKLKVIDLPKCEMPEGIEMPEPKDYMLEKQLDGEELDAEEVFQETWMWLRDLGCEKIVNVQLVRNYAMSVSRWIQCEHAISEYGFLAKHPTTGQSIASPYVSMSQNYMKQVNNLWCQIFQVVKENCTSDYSGATPNDDIMEKLLKSKNQ